MPDITKSIQTLEMEREEAFMIVQSRKNQIIFVAVVLIIVIPAMAYYAVRENFFLMRLKPSDRVTLGTPQPLADTDPAYQEAMKKMADNSIGSSSKGSSSSKASFNRDIDGDKKGDKISSTQAKLSIRMTSSGAKYRQRFLTLENIVSVGFDDIDGDENIDAWFSRGGKSETDVIWNKGKGRFKGKQMLNYEDDKMSIRGGKSTFFDVDKDGQLDLVFEKGAKPEEKKEVFWIKLSKSGK